MAGDVIARLRALHEAAEHGPWFYRGNGSRCVDLPGYWIAAEPTEAELIAALRNAAPALLDVAEAARRVDECPEEHSLGVLSDALAALDRLEGL